jgi:tRNA threonylcarbamoyladenosine modification (KEOPS) complex  Pcc1 subunit
MSVEAKDTVALRATLNAFLRWINSTLSIIDILDNKQL